MSADGNDGTRPRRSRRLSPTNELALKGELQSWQGGALRRWPDSNFTVLSGRVPAPTRSAPPRDPAQQAGIEVGIGVAVEGIVATTFGQVVDHTNDGLAATGPERAPGTPFTVEDVVEVPAQLLDRLRRFGRRCAARSARRSAASSA